MVVEVRPMADEAVLVEIAGLELEDFRQRERQRGGGAHPVESVNRLEGGVVEIDERFVAEIERRRGLAAERNPQLDVGPQAPAGAVDVVAPALLEPQPRAKRGL